MQLKLKGVITIISICIVVYILYVLVLQAIIYKITHKLYVKDFWNYVYIYKEIFIDKDYDAILPKPGDVIFDVGGNQGLYTLYLNDISNNVSIHVFEPIFDLYQQLHNNVVQNTRTTNTIVTNNFGLSDRDEETVINYYPTGSGLSTLTSDMDEKQQMMIESKCSGSLAPGVCKTFMEKVFMPRLNKNKTVQTVKLTTMSKYIERNNISKIDIVKIDVEGHELQVLKGIKDEHFDRIRSFMIEVENYRPGYLQKIVDILKQHNYTIHVKDEKEKWCMVTAKKQLRF